VLAGRELVSLHFVCGARVLDELTSVGNLIYCASRGRALLDRILLDTRNWDLLAARHVLFCGVSTCTVENSGDFLKTLLDNTLESNLCR